METGHQREEEKEESKGELLEDKGRKQSENGKSRSKATKMEVNMWKKWKA